MSDKDGEYKGMRWAQTAVKVKEEPPKKRRSSRATKKTSADSGLLLDEMIRYSTLASRRKGGSARGKSSKTTKTEEKESENALPVANDSAPLLLGFRTVVGETVCVVCRSNHDEADVILCEGCNAEFHRRCVRPPLAAVPVGRWLCPECTSTKLFVSDPARYFPDESPTIFRDAMKSAAKERAFAKSLPSQLHVDFAPEAAAFLHEAYDMLDE